MDLRGDVVAAQLDLACRGGVMGLAQSRGVVYLDGEDELGWVVADYVGGAGDEIEAGAYAGDVDEGLLELQALAQADVVAVLGVGAAVAVEDAVEVVESVVVGAVGRGEDAQGELHEFGLEDALGAHDSRSTSLGLSGPGDFRLQAEEGDAVGVEGEAFEEEGAGEFVAVEYGLVGGAFTVRGMRMPRGLAVWFCLL